MSKTIKPTDLGAAISAELTLYHEDVVEKVNSAGASAIAQLVKKTKEKAPVETGDFRKSLTSKEVPAAHGMKNYILYAKAPHHRVFHLLVHGHAKKGGGRVSGNPFLQNAIDEVLPEYEQQVEEALK